MVEGVFSAPVLEDLSIQINPLLSGLGRVRGGVRDLFARSTAVRDLAGNPKLRAFVEPIIGPDCVAINATLFDKAEGRNWKVPYHQDVTIRVHERKDAPGFGPWWEKDGVPHVWPPASVLEKVLAVRIHLDDCGEVNGPLRIIPGSHRAGILSSEQIDKMRDRGPEVNCNVRAGGIVLMRPLLLHASSTAENPRQRRVIHFEYAPPNISGVLDWYDQVGPTRSRSY